MCLHSQEATRIGKVTEIESRIEVIRAWVVGKGELFNGYGVYVRDDEKVLSIQYSIPPCQSVDTFQNPQQMMSEIIDNAKPYMEAPQYYDNSYDNQDGY